MVSKSSNRWLKEHFSDPYVKQAQMEGFRSRAVYKLLEIAKRDRLFISGMTVIDLGAAPGGWSQVLAQQVKPKGCVIAVDLLAMEEVAGVTFIQGDFTEEACLQSLLSTLPSGQKIDWVLSDMAPNMSGNDSVDIPRAMYLAESVLDFSLKVLKPTGGCLIKVFQGVGFEAFMKELKQQFRSVVIRKPKASRDRSREVYILARQLKTGGV